MRAAGLAGCLLSGLAAAAAAVEPSHHVLDPVRSGARLDPAIASPQQFLGFEIGSRPIRHDELLRYFAYLAEATGRADLARYGETPGGRDLVTLTVSDPQHLANLDAIRERRRRIAVEPAANAGPIAETPAAAWMGYGIHGDELSSTDAAVMLAYRLTAGEDPAIAEIRRYLVVTVDPMFNPDGRARALAHVGAFRRSQPALDHQDIAHRPFWPGGRGNHYFFDLNRDALFQVQTQSRQRVKAILEADPQLFVDAHEMDWDDTFHFGLPNEPMNPHIPDAVHQSWAEFARDLGAAFDAIGRSYYTRSWNEVFYPGFYEIWPAYFGVTPILYEQASTAGLAVRKSNDTTLYFRTAVENHFRSSMATLAAAARNRSTLFERWARVQSEARRGRSVGAQRSWIVLPDDGYKYAELLRILLAQRVEVRTLAAPVKARGLRSWRQDEAEERSLPAGSLKIDVAQARAGIVRNIFDFHVPMSETFLALEKRNLDLGLESGLYDVGAWSLPLAFDAPVYWSERSVPGDWQPVESFPATPGRAEVRAGNYGYVYTDDALHATMRLLRRGVRIRLSRESFVHDGVRFPSGSFLVRNEDQAADALPALNAEHLAGEIALVPVDSARILDGPDFGGDEYNLLDAPEIAIVGGAGIAAESFGETWHLLDRVVGVPVTLLDLDGLDDQDLSKYTVIVLPAVDEDGARDAVAMASEALTAWIERGGTLITLGSASLAAADAGLVSSKTRGRAMKDYPPLMIGRTAKETLTDDFLGVSARPRSAVTVLAPVVSPAARPFLEGPRRGFDFAGRVRTLKEWSAGVPLTDEDAARLAKRLQAYLPSGAYLRVELRPKHFLSYGMGEQLPVLFNDVEDVLIAGTDAELVGRYAAPETLMLSGLVWPEATGYIAGTAYLVTEEKDAGRVISFATNPLFRGYSLGTARLFMNALLLGNALDCCT